MTTQTSPKAVLKSSTTASVTLTPSNAIHWKTDKNKPAAVLKALSAGQLLTEKIPRRLNLMSPWLREGESVLLYAPTGAGKSLFALSLAMRIAGGGAFMAWEPDAASDPKGWRVLYVDGEMHLGDIQERLKGLLAGMDGIDQQRVRDNLLVLSRQAQTGEDEFPSITDPGGARFYRDLVSAHATDLIILDNFSTLGEVEDENSASSFNPLTQTLLSLKQKGVATMLVHHTGKPKGIQAPIDFRGSSKLGATFEVILALDPRRVERAEAGGSTTNAAFLTNFQKMRSGKMPPEVWATLEAVMDGLHWRYDVGNARHGPILEGLQEGRWRYQKDIAAELGVDPATIGRDIESGILLGIFPSRRWVDTKLREAATETLFAGDPSVRESNSL